MRSILTLTTCYFLTFSSCISTRRYGEAEQNFCDCLSGVLAPADEFCSEWNHQVAEEWAKLDLKMKSLLERNPAKALEIQTQIDSIKAKRQVCLEAILKQ